MHTASLWRGVGLWPPRGGGWGSGLPVDGWVGLWPPRGGGGWGSGLPVVGGGALASLWRGGWGSGLPVVGVGL